MHRTAAGIVSEKSYCRVNTCGEVISMPETEVLAGGPWGISKTLKPAGARRPSSQACGCPTTIQAPAKSIHAHFTFLSIHPLIFFNA